MHQDALWEESKRAEVMIFLKMFYWENLGFPIHVVVTLTLISSLFEKDVP